MQVIAQLSRFPATEALGRGHEILDFCGMGQERYRPVETYSTGMRQKLRFAMAIVHDPKLLILDEPSAGVDIEMRRSMWEFLRRINEQGTTIILTTHYLEEGEALCRHIAIINHGIIVENTSIKTLLRQLRREVFILDCVEDLPPSISIDGFTTRRSDDHTLEVEVEKGQYLNQIFSTLAADNIHVSSMRNRANRLEEMFVNLVEGSE